jgi:ferrous iron transport protein B
MTTSKLDRRPATSDQRRSVTVALLGNPNTGKTTLFNALAGMRQRVGNYPGVTVEMKKGHLHHRGQTFDLVDLPGTYSLAPRSPDEMVAVDLILGQQPGEARPDVVVTISDASNLERNLYLMTQALELGVPVVVALNMIDVAQGQGIRIDAERLSGRLGVRVVPIQANRKKGLDQLKEAIAQAAEEAGPVKGPSFPEAFEQELATLQEAVGAGVPPFLVRRLLLDVGGHTERRLAERCGPELSGRVQAARQRLAAAGCPVPAVEARTRYAWIREALSGCVQRPAQRPITWTDRLDRVLTHKVWGTLLFLALMFVVFQSIFTWARPLMDLIGKGQDFLGGLVHGGMEPGPLRSLLIDGVIKGVGSVLVFLPQIMILFGFIAVLEDCGYMARAAFLMDKLMARCGLSGKSFIPMLSSIACAVPGIMAARVIENRRDRFATILVAPLMSCSARLPVYMLLIGAFLSPARGFDWWVPGMTLFALYLLGLLVAPLMAFLLKRTFLRGETPVFVMEMPLYKLPSLRTVVHRMTHSGWMFVRRAGTLILATMIVVWALLYFPVSHPEGGSYDSRISRLEDSIEQESGERDRLKARVKAGEANAADKARLEKLEEKLKPVEDLINQLQSDWTRQSYLGEMGKAIEPVVAPLGWDWKIGMAAIASFPAREVMVGTLGMIYGQGKVEADEIREAGLSGQTELGAALQQEEVFSVPVALSVMVFFALCCQCASTLAVIRRETNSWRWPLFTFVYMTVLAYLGALVVFQVGTLAEGV